MSAADTTTRPQIAPIQIGRNVANINQIMGMAHYLGVTVTDPDDLHVTLIWSRTAVDWSLDVFAPRHYPIIVEPQMMSLERFGDLAVLTFYSQALHARNKALTAAGAKSDHKDFKLHITLGPWPEEVEPQDIMLGSPLVLSGEYRKPAKI
jgi:hypothetical protein